VVVPSLVEVFDARVDVSVQFSEEVGRVAAPSAVEIIDGREDE
jgi:hypothetical protein